MSTGIRMKSSAAVTFGLIGLALLGSGLPAARAQAIYAEIGKTVALSGNGGASESALAMAVGTPALDGLGFVGGNFHTDHEWIDLNSITPRLYLFTRLLMEAGAAPPRRSTP